MNDAATVPELSVVVPVLNEAAILPELFRTLSGQEGIALELVVSDGGSADGSAALARRLAADAPFPVTVVSGEKGRGRQLNAGAAASGGGTLLFLHADSRFADPRALRTGVDSLAAAARVDARVAGRYALRFARRAPAPSLAYHYYECKARLDRRECTHGDQGLMLRRPFFAEVGPFDEALPMVAETRLAETVRRRGAWLLFPAEILTSARRFESEGLYERQLLNAILMNFAAMGWVPFFRELHAIYPSHDRSGRLELAPLLRRVDGLIAALPLRERLALWYAAGAYVRSHAWQIPFFLDVRRAFRRGTSPGRESTPLLACHDHVFDRITDHLPGRLTAAFLTWLWFRLTSFRLCRRKRSTG